MSFVLSLCWCNEDSPVISCPREEYRASVGDRAVLSCSVRANPGSQLTWMSSVGDKLTEHTTDPSVNVSIKVRQLAATALLSLSMHHCRIFMQLLARLDITNAELSAVA